MPSSQVVMLLRHLPERRPEIDPVIDETLKIFGALEPAREVHFFPASGEGEVDQIWVVVESVTPSIIRSLTDALTDVELEYDQIFDLHIARGNERAPKGAQALLIKE